MEIVIGDEFRLTAGGDCSELLPHPPLTLERDRVKGKC